MRTLALLAALCLAPAALAADPTIPVRIRTMKGSRQGPPSLDPRKPVDLRLPGGTALQLVLEASRAETVTLQLKVPARQTQSRITISKTQRIVHQVTDERNGEALFVSLRPWP
jgi:hypothetical protein